MKTTISIFLLATLALTTVHCQVEEVVNENGNNPNACATVMCAFGYRCIESPKRCFTTPCPQYDCVPVEENESGQSGQVDPQVRQGDEQTGQAYGSRCAAVMCAWGYRCVEKPNNQFECVKMEKNDAGQENRPTSPDPVVDITKIGYHPNACATVMCAFGYRCIETPKACFTTPCPQHECVPINAVVMNGRNDNEDRPNSSRPVLDNGLPDPCSPNPCPEGKRCFNFPKFCIRAPCPQYGCTDIY